MLTCACLRDGLEFCYRTLLQRIYLHNITVESVESAFKKQSARSQRAIASDKIDARRSTFLDDHDRY